MKSKNVSKMMAFVATAVLVFSLLTVAMPTSLAAETTDYIDAEDVTVDAGDEANITVTAYNETDEPVEGENITVEDAGGIDHLVDAYAETDENGTAWFPFTETTADEYVVNFTAEDTTIYDNATVTVEPAEVDDVVITPDTDKTITAGETENFTAEAYDENDNLITDDVTMFEWTYIRDYNETANEAIFDQAIAGEYNVSATYGEVTSENTTVTVEEAGVDRVDIYPAEDQEILSGNTIQFYAEAYANDTLITDYLEDFEWEYVNEDGVFAEEVGGVYEVTATFEGVSNATTVTVREPAFFDVNITAPEDGAEYEEGDTVTVEYTVTNTGDEEDTQSIRFFESRREDTEEVTLGGGEPGEDGETHTGTFTWTAEEPGDYDLSVFSDDEDESINIMVNEEVIPDPANFEVEITNFDDEVEEGDTVTVEFTVENTGEEEATQDIVFSIDGTEENTMEITLEGGESDSGEFEWEAGEPGDYDLTVESDDDSDSVTVTVEEEEEAPGFTTMLLILGAIVAVAIYYKKEQ
ncbi:MAG: CARDB domain-containing protein [Candidatus Natronoplasma sp.]